MRKGQSFRTQFCKTRVSRFGRPWPASQASRRPVAAWADTFLLRGREQVTRHGRALERQETGSVRNRFLLSLSGPRSHPPSKSTFLQGRGRRGRSLASPGFKDPLGPQLHLETICGRDSAGCSGGRPGDSGPSPLCSPTTGPSRAQNCGSPSRDREPVSSGNPAALASLAVISERSARSRLGPLSLPGASAQRGQTPPPLCLPRDPGSATLRPGHSCLTAPHSRAPEGLGNAGAH